MLATRRDERDRQPNRIEDEHRDESPGQTRVAVGDRVQAEQIEQPGKMCGDAGRGRNPERRVAQLCSQAGVTVRMASSEPTSHPAGGDARGEAQRRSAAASSITPLTVEVPGSRPTPCRTSTTIAPLIALNARPATV